MGFREVVFRRFCNHLLQPSLCLHCGEHTQLYIFSLIKTISWCVAYSVQNVNSFGIGLSVGDLFRSNR